MLTGNCRKAKAKLKKRATRWPR